MKKLIGSLDLCKCLLFINPSMRGKKILRCTLWMCRTNPGVEWPGRGESSLGISCRPGLERLPSSTPASPGHRWQKGHIYSLLQHTQPFFPQANFTVPFGKDESDSFSLLRVMRRWHATDCKFNRVRNAELPVVFIWSHLISKSSVEHWSHKGDAGTRSDQQQRGFTMAPLPLSLVLLFTSQPSQPLLSFFPPFCHPLSLHPCISNLIKSKFKCTACMTDSLPHGHSQLLAAIIFS